MVKIKKIIIPLLLLTSCMVQQTNKPVNVELKKELKSSLVVKDELKKDIIEQKNDNIIINSNLTGD